MRKQKVYIWVLLFAITLLLSGNNIYSQEKIEGITTRAIIVEGDTLPYIELMPFTFFSPKTFKNSRERKRYTKLIRNVKKVYPYARLAGIKYRKYGAQLAQLETESERKKMAKQLEEEIRDQFEGELRKLTISQGHILIKLIDRETSQSSYDVLKDFRGMFSAVFWQSFGRIFGYNLKTKYDPLGEDKEIEQIVTMIEMGVI